MDDAYCANSGTDPDAFILNRYESHRSARVKLVKLICDQCVVQLECLEAAIVEGDVSSIRGGLTPGERENIIKLDYES